MTYLMFRWNRNYANYPKENFTGCAIGKEQDRIRHTEHGGRKIDVPHRLVCSRRYELNHGDQRGYVWRKIPSMTLRKALYGQGTVEV